MKKILVSAFACNPVKGSEEGYGWNWSVGIANHGYEVHCITRIVGKEHIIRENNYPNLYFHFIELPFGLEKLYRTSTIGMYLYYLLWQYAAYILAKKLNKKYGFSLLHHVTWGSLQLGSFMYKLGVPFIFGPVGGGQIALYSMKDYFGKYWGVEEKRISVSKLLVRFNPACRQTLKKATLVLTSNRDTFTLSSSINSNNLKYSIDVCLPQSFFPSDFKPKQLSGHPLRLLWVGRLMPRKGLNLVLDVMKELKMSKNITLTVVGDGELRQDVEDQIRKYELADTVTLLGTIAYDQIKHCYSEHDILFFTPLRESGGLQILEAMAYGLPVVTLNLHGPGELVTNSRGYACPIEDSSQIVPLLKKEILSYLNNSIKLTEQSTNAFLYAREQTWDKKIENIISEYYC